MEKKLYKYILKIGTIWVSFFLEIAGEFEYHLIFHQTPLNLNHYNHHIILMAFDGISNNTQIVPILKHTRSISLRMSVKFFFSIFKIFYKFI
jgi:hypothetical protein